MVTAFTKCKHVEWNKVGKWYLGHLEQYLPTSRGFNEAFFTPFTHGEVFAYNGSSALCPLMHNTTILGWMQADHSSPVPPANANHSHQGSDYIPFDWLLPMYTKEAIKFIETNRGYPFFLYYAPDCTHLPVYWSDIFMNTSLWGEYGDAVKEMDWSIGQIVSTLGHLNISQHTVIFFASDNGPALYESLKNRTGITTPGMVNSYHVHHAIYHKMAIPLNVNMLVNVAGMHATKLAPCEFLLWNTRDPFTKLSCSLLFS